MCIKLSLLSYTTNNKSFIYMYKRENQLRNVFHIDLHKFTKIRITYVLQRPTCSAISNKMDVLSDKSSRINLLKDRGVSNREIKHSAGIFDSILILFTGCTSWCYPRADLTLPALTVNFQEASRRTDLSDMIINQASKIINSKTIILNGTIITHNN